MNKQIIIQLILVLLTLNATSQTVSTSKDSTTLPNEQLKKAINIIEVAKVQKKELYVVKEKVLQMDSLIATKDSLIFQLKKKSSYQDSVIKGYVSVVGNFKKSLENANEAFEIQKGVLKEEKKKKWIALILGVALGKFLIK